MTHTTLKNLLAKAKADVPNITCQEYRDARAENKPHVLIDVREKEEFDAGHIEGAIHIPRGFLEFKIEQSVPDTQTPIIVQCASGGRAVLSGQTLLNLGYSHVQNLEGGYNEWLATSEA